MAKPKVIVICGPTASGKTALSIELAKYVNKQAAKEAYPQSFLFATHKAKG